MIINVLDDVTYSLYLGAEEDTEKQLPLIHELYDKLFVYHMKYCDSCSCLTNSVCILCHKNKNKFYKFYKFKAAQISLMQHYLLWMSVL